MNNEKFNEVVGSQLDYCCSLLLQKGKEYSLETDRLLAFKKAAALQGETPQKALCGMLAKHIVSIYDMCASNETFTDDRWTEKITDAINYLLLLKAVIRDGQD